MKIAGCVRLGVAFVFFSGIATASDWPQFGALVGLGFGGLAAMLIGLCLTGSTWRVMMNEGRRLNEAMGSATTSSRTM